MKLMPPFQAVFKEFVMHPNVGPADRILRAILGFVLIAVAFIPALPLFGSAPLQAIATIVGLVPLLTALARYCPLYRLMGFSTCKVQTDD